MNEEPSPFPRRRNGMGPVRLTIVALLVLLILAVDYDWLTTPWWEKAMRVCGSLGIQGMLRNLSAWLGW